ncbi:hypothetical protein ACFMPD_12425 [Sedimentitalea sp. HM32M-2]|uniref:hypothetical protein n=1 Tax=Sedimentitalea sp. HM32M-2 TaxID=3351566 RepID=UPI00363F5333
MTKLRAALLRIELGVFGHCMDCGKTIQAKRLPLNSAVAKLHQLRHGLNIRTMHSLHNRFATQ